jgi:hypothetical protein
MNEFILVEFIALGDDRAILIDKLEKLEGDFQFIKTHADYDIRHDTVINEWYIVFGRIDSMYASMIKLQDPFLSERMRISYISEELKNKYRS